MNYVGPATFLTQPVVDCAGVKGDEPTRTSNLGCLEKHVRRQIGDEQRNTANGRLIHNGRGIVLVRETHRLDRTKATG